MKKILILLVISVLSVTIVACGLGEKNNEASDPIEKVEISLSIDEIIDEMYVSSGLEWPNTMKTQLSEENLQYMLGLETLDFIEGTASEPMMSSQAHSIVLFKLSSNQDIESIKSDIKNKVDGRKWICVGVEDENIRVVNAGDYVLLVMDEQSEVLVNAFLEIMGQ